MLDDFCHELKHDEDDVTTSLQFANPRLLDSHEFRHVPDVLVSDVFHDEVEEYGSSSGTVKKVAAHSSSANRESFDQLQAACKFMNPHISDEHTHGVLRDVGCTCRDYNIVDEPDRELHCIGQLLDALSEQARSDEDNVSGIASNASTRSDVIFGEPNVFHAAALPYAAMEMVLSVRDKRAA